MWRSGLDREQAEAYLLVVEARDGGGMMGTGTATVRVRDTNDHAPRFTQHSCLARISENAELNAEVLSFLSYRNTLTIAMDMCAEYTPNC